MWVTYCLLCGAATGELVFGVCVLVGGLFWLVCAICLCCIVCDSDFLCVVLFGCYVLIALL